MILPSLKVEKTLWKKGLNYVAGIDEVGRGSWAGPLVAAGVILPKTFQLPQNLRDSKQLTQNQREELDVSIRKSAIDYSVVEISHSTIIKIGLASANQVAFKNILKKLHPNPDFAIIDGFPVKNFSTSKQMAIKFGDAKCATIAAASIIAKVYRDKLMEKLSIIYPKYGFEKHKGYGTKIHQDAIQKYGFCNIHRVNYNLNFLFL
jgi:ribonuclease HII